MDIEETGCDNAERLEAALKDTGVELKWRLINTPG
jgi:hypothetical protein